MKRGRQICRRAWACTMFAWAAAAYVGIVFPARAEALTKPTLLNLRFEQKLGAHVPVSLWFTNEAGLPVRLGDCVAKRPSVLVLGYYGCPMLCGLVLNGAVESFQDMRATAGKDFNFVFVSIDPHETPALADAKKRSFLKRYGRKDVEAGWHFVVGGDAEIKTLAEAVGFQYAYDSALKQYAHPSGVVVLTPEGKVSRYFFGVSYPAADLSAALKEASAQRVGSPVRSLLILCFQHMPLVGKNSATVMGAVRGLAVATVLAVAGFIAVSRRREKRRCPETTAAPRGSEAG